MIETVIGVQHASAAQNLHPSLTQKVDVPEEPLQRPSNAQAAEFSRATQDAAVREVNAAPVASPSEWGAGVAHQVDNLASHLKGFNAGHKSLDFAAAPERPHTTAEDSKEELTGAVSQMERAYMFAIEATMASRGSTEATKILNTLLKGQ
jgi:hypothetical protein